MKQGEDFPDFSLEESFLLCIFSKFQGFIPSLDHYLPQCEDIKNSKLCYKLPI